MLDNVLNCVLNSVVGCVALSVKWYDRVCCMVC